MCQIYFVNVTISVRSFHTLELLRIRRNLNISNYLSYELMYPFFSTFQSRWNEKFNGISNIYLVLCLYLKYIDHWKGITSQSKRNEFYLYSLNKNIMYFINYQVS